MDASRNGQWLAFDSNRRGNFDIYRLALPGGEPEGLTDDPADEFDPSWSPNGEEIAFYSFRYGSRDLFVMNADGTQQTRVTDDPGTEAHPSWSPDGNSLVFTRTPMGNRELWVVSRANRTSAWESPRLLTPEGGQYPEWSPDGEWIVYPRSGEIRLIPAEGGDYRILAGVGTVDIRPGGRPAWSPDSRTVYFKSIGEGSVTSLWSVSVSGGEPRLLIRLDDPTRPSLRGGVVTDGERLFFTLGTQESDIWVLDLLPG
jgi:TolB protein